MTAEKRIVTFLGMAAIVFAGGCASSEARTTATSRPALAPPWEPCREGVKLTLDLNQTFEAGKATLSKQGAKAVQEAAATIVARCPDQVIRVYGFCGDAHGAKEFGPQEQWAQCWGRACAISEALRAAGVHGDNVETIGVGRFRPAVPNAATAPNDPVDRPVEIVISLCGLGAPPARAESQPQE